MADLLTPIYEITEKPEGLELVYVVRWKENIIKNEVLIDLATKEITLYMNYSQIMEEIRSSLVGAKKCCLKVNLGITKDAF